MTLLGFRFWVQPLPPLIRHVFLGLICAEPVLGGGNPILDLTGIKRAKRTHISISLTHGGDLVSVSQRLGHSDTAVTLRMYAHANEESIRKAGQAVRDALKAQGQ